MVTELEYSRALNTKGWSFIAKKTAPIALITAFAILYAKHSDIHEQERSKFFYNKSKLYGTAKTPQY